MNRQPSKIFSLKHAQEELDQAYQAEFKAAAKHFHIDLHVDELELLCLTSTLQLAMRHPVFQSRPTGKWCQAFIEKLIAAVPQDRPALRAMLEAGNNPAFDEMPGRPKV